MSNLPLIIELLIGFIAFTGFIVAPLLILYQGAKTIGKR